MRFCQAFVTELWRHIGPQTDVPAGDIGVGGREVRLHVRHVQKTARENTGTFTGKGLEFGGSLHSSRSNGYGNVYFLLEMLKTRNIDIKDKVVAVSGSGNVAQYTVEKLISLGAKVITMSDSNGYIYDPDGIDAEKLAYIFELKNIYRGTYPRIRRKIRLQICRRSPSLEREMRYCHALGHPKRNRRRRCPRSSCQWLFRRIGRRQYALHSRSYRRIPQSQNPLRSGKAPMPAVFR